MARVIDPDWSMKRATLLSVPVTNPTNPNQSDDSVEIPKEIVSSAEKNLIFDLRQKGRGF